MVFHVIIVAVGLGSYLIPCIPLVALKISLGYQKSLVFHKFLSWLSCRICIPFFICNILFFNLYSFLKVERVLSQIMS